MPLTVGNVRFLYLQYWAFLHCFWSWNSFFYFCLCEQHELSEYAEFLSLSTVGNVRFLQLCLLGSLINFRITILTTIYMLNNIILMNEQKQFPALKFLTISSSCNVRLLQLHLLGSWLIFRIKVLQFSHCG